MIVPKNEGKVCDAVVRTLEKRTRETRADVQSPDKEGAKPPVDLRLRLGAQNYAIEHTRIESFKNQITAVAAAKRIIGYVREHIPDPFPSPAYYELQFPIEVSVPKGRRKGDRALCNLVKWIREQETILRERSTCRILPIRNPHTANDSIQGVPPGFDCEFELLHWPFASLIRRKPGMLSFQFISPNDPESLRTNSLRRSFFKKCPKLQECKAEHARTVLVIESSDTEFMSFEFRGSLLPSILAELENVPDEIFLVETFTNRWRVWLLKRDESHWPDTGMPELGGFYYDPDTSDTSEWLASISKHMRDALQLENMHTPFLPGWAPTDFKKDELNNLTAK